MERLHQPRTLEKVRRNNVTKTKNSFVYKIIDSPVGQITLVATDKALISLMWGKNKNDLKGFVRAEKNHAILTIVEAQLKDYFKGKRKTFDIPLVPEGTEFQKLVWLQLLKIPFGETISYGEQAKRLGKPNAARAVGAANGKNPIGIIIPCHRVIGASGSLTGFAGGLDAKKFLLALEGRL